MTIAHGASRGSTNHQDATAPAGAYENVCGPVGNSAESASRRGLRAKSRRSLRALRCAALLVCGLMCTARLISQQPSNGAALPSEEPQALLTAGADDGYVDTSTCAGCHQEIAEASRRTGMGRSFTSLTAGNLQADFTRNNTFYHEASDRYYSAYERGGKYYLRRHQVGSAGAEVNVVEKEIHYVVGSGNHARSYLHRTPDGRLLQLPPSWYSENGGFWAMSPGYDHSDHQGFRRAVDFECMSCHNAYPEIEPGFDDLEHTPRFPGRVPSGIDCQRCHGPGRKHLRALAAGEPPAKVRQAIVNPARLSSERQLEVCMQCHLETTSHRLPHSILRFGRRAFSYRPGQPLEDHVLHFDHAPGSGYDDKFEVVQSVYRLRKSACFTQSKGAMTCTTCHDPHDVPRGDQATRHYSRVCQSCHTDIAANVQDNKHTTASECLSCHMPKRRTEDAVHSVMTDHYIQRRRPDRDLLTPRKEVSQTVAYRGEVVLYYPSELEDAAEADLYLAVAQVRDGSNLEKGIARLARAIEEHQPAQAEFYFELAEAYLKTRQFDEAIRLYEAAIERRPNYLLARRNLGLALLLAGRLPQATETTRAVLNEAPKEAEVWNALGETYYPQRKLDEAVEAFEKAVTLDPDLAEAHNNLGAAKLLQGNVAEAEQAFREAVRIKPDFAAAQKNLAALPAKPSSAPAGDDLQQLIALAQTAERENRLDDAARLYEQILEQRPGWAAARLNLGLVYHSAALYPEAIRALSEVIEQDPSLTSADLFLGASYYHLDQYSKAVELLEAYLAREPDSDEVRGFLAASYYGLKDHQNAALQYLQQMRFTPDDPWRESFTSTLERVTPPWPERPPSLLRAARRRGTTRYSQPPSNKEIQPPPKSGSAKP